VEIWTCPYPPPRELKFGAKEFITSLNMLLLDLDHGVADCRSMEWMRNCTGKFMHLHLDASHSQIFHKLVRHEDTLTPRRHKISTHELSFMIRNVEPARREWLAKTKAAKAKAAKEKIAAEVRKSEQWELWLRYDHTRPKALTLPAATEAVLGAFREVDLIEFVHLQLGGGEHSSDILSCKIRVIAWGLLSNRLPWYLLDPNQPDYPIRYDTNWKETRHACRICHNICSRCSEFVQEPGVPADKWRDQKYWECPYWKLLNPIQEPTPAKSRDVSLMEMMKGVKKHRRK
jgi:hypothetical protein